MGEDLLDHGRLQDRCDDLQLAAAVRAVLKVEIKDALEQTGQTRAMRPVRSVVGLARLRLRRRGEFGIFWHNLRAHLRIRHQHPMKPYEVKTHVLASYVGAKALDQRHCAAVGFGALQTHLVQQKARDHPVHDPQNRRGQLRLRGQQQAQWNRQRQNPLANRYTREDRKPVLRSNGVPGAELTQPNPFLAKLAKIKT